MKLPRFLSNIVRAGQSPEIVTTRNFDDLASVLEGSFGVIEKYSETTDKSLSSKLNTRDFIRFRQRFSDIYFPEDYGAFGDGINNDAVSIQLAIDAAFNAGGGIVQLSAATYYISSASLTLRSNVHLKGLGTSRSILLSAGGDIDILPIEASAENVSASGFRLYVSTTDGGYGIRGVGASVSRFFDLEFDGVGRPIYLTNCDDLNILHIKNENTNTAIATSHTIRMLGCSNYVLNGIWVEGHASGTYPSFKGISGAVAFHNGGKVYGNHKGSVLNVYCNGHIDRGITGEPAFPEIYGGYYNVYFNRTLPTYVSPIASDIGKIVSDGSDNVGILVDYDNDCTPPVWCVQWRTPSTSYSTIDYGSTLSVTAGTGSGGTLKAPVTEKLEFVGSGYTNAISGDLTKVVVQGGATLGHLVSFDNTRRQWKVQGSITINTGTGAGLLTGMPDGTSTLTFLAVGYTNCVVGDIGKTVRIEGVSIGTLVSYDNAAKQWVLSAATTPPIPAMATTITAGTGAGTTNNFGNFQYDSPSTYSNTWSHIRAYGAIHNLIGHGISMDTCWYTHVSEFDCRYNHQVGLYIGDTDNFGSTVSNGSCTENQYGIVLANACGIPFSNLDISNNSGFGVRWEPIDNGRYSVVDYTVFTNCKITRNGYISSGSGANSGVSGALRRAAFINCNISENYRHNVFLADAAENIFQGCQINDAGWMNVIGGQGVRMEGNSFNNLIEGNYIGRAFPSLSSQSHGVLIVTNSNDNVVRNNFLVNNKTAAYADSGLRNQFWDNQETYDPSVLANGTGNILRTLAASAVRFSALTAGSGYAIDAQTISTTSAADSAGRFRNVNTSLGLEPFTPTLVVENLHSDFSSPMMIFRNAGAGVINSANGSWLLYQDAGIDVFRLARDGIELGAGTRILKHSSATGVLDWGSISAGATSELTISVTGVAAGDMVMAVPSGAPESGLVWSALAGTNLVTIRLGNVTTGAIDPASRTWRVDWWKH